MTNGSDRAEASLKSDERPGEASPAPEKPFARPSPLPRWVAPARPSSLWTDMDRAGEAPSSWSMLGGRARGREAPCGAAAAAGAEAEAAEAEAEAADGLPVGEDALGRAFAGCGPRGDSEGDVPEEDGCCCCCGGMSPAAAAAFAIAEAAAAAACCREDGEPACIAPSDGGLEIGRAGLDASETLGGVVGWFGVGASAAWEGGLMIDEAGMSTAGWSGWKAAAASKG